MYIDTIKPYSHVRKQINIFKQDDSDMFRNSHPVEEKWTTFYWCKVGVTFPSIPC